MGYAKSNRDEVLRAFRPQSVAVDPLVNTSEFAAILGIHPVTLFRRMHAKDFPKPIRLSANRIAWRMSVVNAYIDSRPVGLAPQKAGAK